MTARYGTLLGGDRIQELVAASVNARVGLRGAGVLDALRVLTSQGNKIDALGFVVGCIHTMAQNLPPGQQAVVAVVRRRPGGGIELCPAVAPQDVPDQGTVLFTQMLVDYLAGRRDLLFPRFMQADGKTAGGAVGAAVKTAANLIRARRASLQ